MKNTCAPSCVLFFGLPPHPAPYTIILHFPEHQPNGIPRKIVLLRLNPSAQTENSSDSREILLQKLRFHTGRANHSFNKDIISQPAKFAPPSNRLPQIRLLSILLHIPAPPSVLVRRNRSVCACPPMVSPWRTPIFYPVAPWTKEQSCAILPPCLAKPARVRDSGDYR